MSERFADKVVVVTGGGAGIGRAISMAFASEGAKVVVAGRTLNRLEETVDMIKEAGGEASLVQTDVCRAADVETMIAETVKRYGKIDCGVNNAGIQGAPSPMVDCDEETWDLTINTNLKGAWLCMKAEIQQMLKQGGGAIVNLSSGAGLVGVQGLAAYSASKHGVLGLTKSAAMEYAKAGIRINAVCPGSTRTEMVERFMVTPEAEAIVAGASPLERLGEPEEIAGAVMWLCSDEASFVIGHAMAVDGGFVAR